MVNCSEICESEPVPEVGWGFDKISGVPTSVRVHWAPRKYRIAEVKIQHPWGDLNLQPQAYETFAASDHVQVGEVRTG